VLKLQYNRSSGKYFIFYCDVHQSELVYPFQTGKIYISVVDWMDIAFDCKNGVSFYLAMRIWRVVRGEGWKTLGMLENCCGTEVCLILLPPVMLIQLIN